jgi:hypothetical protein
MFSRLRLPVLLSAAALVFALVFSMTAIMRSRDPQTAAGCIAGPVFGVLLMLPAFLAGKAIEAAVAVVKRSGLHVEWEQVGATPSWMAAGVLVAAVAVGIWLAWATP